MRRSIEATLRALDKQVKQLRAAALKLIESDPTLHRRYELLLTVKGIGQISAISILAELTAVKNATKLITERRDAKADKALVDEAIAGL